MLLEIFDDDGGAVAELLDSALESIEVDLVRIERAAAVTDFPALLEAAHRLKGTSGSITSSRVADVSSAIERAANERRGSLVESLLDELRQSIEVLRIDIEAAKQQIDA